MRKAFLLVAALAIFVFAGAGSAQKFGFYLGYGYDGMMGGQYYFSDNMRVSLGITPIVGIGIGGSLDYILGNVDLAKGSNQQLQAYYGVGAGASFASFLGISGFGIQAHGLGGIEFGIPESNMSVFAEFGLGPSMGFVEDISVFTIGYDFKIGMLFQ